MFRVGSGFEITCNFMMNCLRATYSVFIYPMCDIPLLVQLLSAQFLFLLYFVAALDAPVPHYQLRQTVMLTSRSV